MNYKEAYEILTNFQKDFPKVEKAFQKGAHKFIDSLAKEVAAELKTEFPNVHRLSVYSIDHQNSDVVVDQDGTKWVTIRVRYAGCRLWDEARLNLARLGELYEKFPYIVMVNHDDEEMHYYQRSKAYVCAYDVMQDLRDRINKHLEK